MIRARESLVNRSQVGRWLGARRALLTIGVFVVSVVVVGLAVVLALPVRDECTISGSQLSTSVIEEEALGNLVEYETSTRTLHSQYPDRIYSTAEDACEQVFMAWIFGDGVPRIDQVFITRYSQAADLETIEEHKGEVVGWSSSGEMWVAESQHTRWVLLTEACIVAEIRHTRSLVIDEQSWNPILASIAADVCPT